ncbi:MAG: ferritin-like domain-containing protein [Acidobacteriia bacterium]|nr:ferritin-like domain-containing protein [Terriglobia bacterium]
MNYTNAIQDVIRKTPNRRKFVGTLGIASAMASMAASRAGAQTTPPTVSDVDILNFALNLEYLDAEFYSAATGTSLAQLGMDVTGSGTAGTTTGGSAVAFSDPTIEAVAMEIAEDERELVLLLRDTITGRGALPVAKPAINLGALNMGFGSQNDFLAVARILEDTAVSAYTGALPMIQSSLVLATAARILGTEAQHDANIRLQVARNNITTKAVDALDILPLPSGMQYFANNGQALAVTRTPGQVLYDVYGGAANVSAGGFFPNGVNGNIKTSSAAPTAPGSSTSSGPQLTANPNPIPVVGYTPGFTTITWSAPNSSAIEIHVGSPTGKLLTQAGPQGSILTGPWVSNGLMFFLQDVSGGQAASPSNTIATLTVTLQRSF